MPREGAVSRGMVSSVPDSGGRDGSFLSVRSLRAVRRTSWRGFCVVLLYLLPMGMAVLGKDLLDFNRPLTHTEIRFGAHGYWVENDTVELPYGTILIELLSYDVSDYAAKLERLSNAISQKEPHETMKAFIELVTHFITLPLYNRYVPNPESVERMLDLAHCGPMGLDSIVDDLFSGEISLDRYRWALEDIRLIQDRYTWFLDELFDHVQPEKKKEQRKLPLAELLHRQRIEAFVSGRSLGADRKVDAPAVNIQYEVLVSANSSTELVEKMYFDRLADFVYVEFMKGLQKGFVPKRYGNCGSWFLQAPGESYSYCDAIAPGEEYKTCRDIGAAASFDAKVKNNIIWEIHRRAYKKYYARTLKKKMSKADFEAWAREAERLRDKAVEAYQHADSAHRKQLEEKLKQELNAL